MTMFRSFQETVQTRVARDPAFRRALLQEAVQSFISGDVDTGEAVLRDYIEATNGYEELSAAIGTPSKSLIRMLGPTATRRPAISSPCSPTCSARPGWK